jgi:putative DNA methylase
MDTTPLGWYSRGYQPHLNVPGLVPSVTTHLADSMPRATLCRLMAETEQDNLARRRRLEDLLDAGHGACWLQRPAIGALVEETLLAGDGEQYRLLVWVVMPNHLHVLIETLPGLALAQIVKGWKGQIRARSPRRALLGALRGHERVGNSPNQRNAAQREGRSRPAQVPCNGA